MYFIAFHRVTLILNFVPNDLCLFTVLTSHSTTIYIVSALRYIALHRVGPYYMSHYVTLCLTGVALYHIPFYCLLYNTLQQCNITSTMHHAIIFYIVFFRPHFSWKFSPLRLDIGTRDYISIQAASRRH